MESTAITATEPIPVDTSGLEAGPAVIVFDVPTAPPTQRALATIVDQAGGRPNREIVEDEGEIAFGGTRLREVAMVAIVLLVVAAAITFALLR